MSIEMVPVPEIEVGDVIVMSNGETHSVVEWIASNGYVSLRFGGRWRKYLITDSLQVNRS
jgi:hypothetical protein